MRILDAGAARRGLDAGDVVHLAMIISLMVGGETLEDAADLRPGWRAAARAKAFARTIAAAPVASKLSLREMRRVLASYAATEFADDLARGSRPNADREFLFWLLVGNGGRVPSVSTLQRRGVSFTPLEMKHPPTPPRSPDDEEEAIRK